MLSRLRNLPVKRSAKRAPSRLLATILLTPVAVSSVATANVVGSDMQNFNPSTSGLDFVTVQSSETLAPGTINFGLFVNQAVNTLPYFDDSTQNRHKFTDSVLGADLNIGIGLLPGLDIGLSAPQVLQQNANSSGFHGQFGDNGNTEVRLNTKLRLWGENNYGIALIGSANINRIKNNPYVGQDAGPTYNLELAADTSFRKFAFGLNIGHRWRKAGEKIVDPIDPLGNQLIASIAVSYLFSSIDTKLIGEVFASKPTHDETENSNRLAQSAEALLGIKHDFTTSLAGHIGAGTELVNGRSSPDWRVYLGLNYTVGPVWSKPLAASSSIAKPQAARDPFAGPPRAKEKIIIHDVLFEFDSDDLVIHDPNDTLGRLVNYLNQKPVFTRLIIEGHTDSVGTEQYNQDLSRRRAETIKKWLIERFHIDPSKIEASGRGESFPIANNGNYQGRQLNRRVEFTIFRNMK